MSWQSESEPAVSSSLPTSEASAETPEWQKGSEISGGNVFDRAGAVLRGAGGAALETGPIVGGMVAGAKLGTLGGPYAPVTVPLGALAGGTAGYFAGREAREQAAKTGVVSPSAESEPPELRSYAYGGEAFGGSIPFAGAPFAFAKQAANAPRFIKPILEFANRNPKAFLGAETASSFGSGLYGGIAEEVLPGETLPRVSAEVLGGFLHPGRLLFQAGNLGMQGVKRFLQSRTAEGTKDAASETLLRIINEAGEDPAALAKALREQSLASGVSSAMKTGSPILTAFENRLMKENPSFSGQYQQMAKDGLDALEGMSRALAATGDPQALKAAAELAEQRMNALLDARFSSAEQQAAEAARRISGDRPGSASQISEAANSAVRGALKDARATENALWSQVPKNELAFLDNTLHAYDKIRADMLPEETLPKIVEGFVERMREGGRGYEAVGDLHKLRSKVLEFGRDAVGRQEFADARIYNQMADAILADMMAVPSTNPILSEARSFSRALHDSFDRSFARKALDRASTGEQRLAPELLLERAFGAGGTGADLRLGQLENAAWFGPRMGRPDTSLGRAMTESQARFIRLAAAESVNPETGRVNPNKLATFLRDNDGLLNRFPDVRRDLSSAEGTERVLRDIEAANAGARKTAHQKEAFSRVLGIEDPSRAIERALTSDAPLANFQAIANMAKTGGADAVDGLRAATMNYAIRRATSATGDFSFPQYQAALMRPLGQNQASAMDIMRQSGAMTAEQATRYKKILEEASRIEGAVRSGVDLDGVLSVPDALYDMVLRIVGSNIAGMGVASKSSPLIAGAAGSKTMRQIFDKVPQGRVTEVLVQAAKEPAFMAALLERPTTERQRIQVARQVNGFLWNAGLVSAQKPREEDRQAAPAQAPRVASPPIPAARMTAAQPLTAVVPNTRGPGRPRKINPNALSLDQSLDAVLGTNDTFAELAAP